MKPLPEKKRAADPPGSPQETLSTAGQIEQIQGLPLLELPDRQAWEGWLESNHLSCDGVWLKLAKKGAPRQTVSQAEAIESAICFGWIDGQVGSLDQHFYRQRFTHRRPTSKWSQINRRRALELIERGLMRPEGMNEVARAQADGRWDAAYEPQGSATVPDDFALALSANPKAQEFFATLTGAKRYAFLYRIQDAKRAETRSARIEKFVALLAAHRTLN